MIALHALAFATLATLGAGQASTDCSTGVTSVVGGGSAWAGAQTLRNGLLSNAGMRDYVFKGVPSFLDGGEYFASGVVWPGSNGAAYTLTINYTAPAMVFVYVSGDGTHDAGMSARLLADGWDSEAVDTFYRFNPQDGHEKVLHVYSKFFDSGSQTMIGPLQGTLVSGVISTCDHPTTTTTTTSTRTSWTSTSMTTTGTTTSSTRTETTTSSTTLSTTTRTWTGTTTTLTTITGTTTSTTTATTTSTSVTTTTITTTTTTTTTVHRVAVIEGQMYITVDRPTELNDQIKNNGTVHQACIHGLANSLPGVEPRLTRILGSELGNQMPSAANGQNGNGQNGNGQNGNSGNSGNSGNNGGDRRLRGAAPRRLTGVVTVTYQVVVPLEMAVLNDLTAQSFLSTTTRDNLNLYVTEQIQAVTDYVISEVEVSEPTFTVTWSDDLEHFFETEESPPISLETSSSDATAAGSWTVILMLSIVGVCCTSFMGWNFVRRRSTQKQEKEVSEDEIYEGNNWGLSARSFGDLSTAGSQMGPEMSEGCRAPPPRMMVTFGAGEKNSDNGSCEGPVFALCDAAHAEQDTVTIEIPGPGKDITYVEQDLDKLQWGSHLGSEESQADEPELSI